MIVRARVCYNEVVRVGDRVRHYGQRYNYSEGTATITGFRELGPEDGYRTGTGEPWVKILVDEDRDSLYGGEWDYDRTVKVETG